MENLYSFGFVKLVSKFYSPEKIGVWINKVIHMYETNTFRSQANTLLAWAIIIVIVATAIDLTFYWIKPEQQLILTKYISKLQGGRAHSNRNINE